MSIRGFQTINVSSKTNDSDEIDEGMLYPKLGLISNEGSYGASVIRFVKREISYHQQDEDDE